MKTAVWLKRADRSLGSASLLLDDGDPDRACSTAYYAMFYAARAALFHVDEPERALGKTHSGMIASFHRFLVHPGLIPAEQGRLLQTEFSRRLLADYDADGVDAAMANEAMASAESLVVAVKALLAESMQE